MDLPDTPETYRARVMAGVLNAVVAAGVGDDGETSMVELQVALGGMCDAIAMLVAATGVDTSPKDRRDTADFCRKRVLTASNQIAARVAAGEPLPWRRYISRTRAQSAADLIICD